jgi:hypothetical protein
VDKKNISLQEAEALRHQVLEYLAGRHPLTWSQKQISQGLKMRGMVDFAFGADDLASAIAVLTDKGLVRKTADGLGSTCYFEATADGLLEWERRH